MSVSDPHTEIREALALGRHESEGDAVEQAVFVQAEAALATLEREAAERETARRREPSDEGGPGKEETYWLRAKLDAAVTHLRDIEDFYRLRGGTPESPNQVRADRARQLYEAIISDFRDGKMYRPTIRERAEAAEARVREVEAERDRQPIDSEAVLWVAALDRVPIEERIEWVAEMKRRVDEINAARAVLASPEAAAAEPETKP